MTTSAFLRFFTRITMILASLRGFEKNIDHRGGAISFTIEAFHCIIKEIDFICILDSSYQVHTTTIYQVLLRFLNTLIFSVSHQDTIHQTWEQ